MMMTACLLRRAVTRASPILRIPGASPLSPIVSSQSNAVSIARRSKGSYIFDGVGGGGGEDMWEWPITKMNTVFNIVPQGHKYVVERFGKLNEVHESGWFIAIPLVDRIAYVIDVRERALYRSLFIGILFVGKDLTDCSFRAVLSFGGSFW
jgi:SPFH domain / Band 7 family